MTRIALNRKTLAIPIVDGIEWNTLQHNVAYFGGALFRGIWEWGFLYKETEIPQREREKMKYQTEPYKSPTVRFKGKCSVLSRRCDFVACRWSSRYRQEMVFRIGCL